MKRDCEKCMYHVECPIQNYYCINAMGFFEDKPDKPCYKYKNYKLSRFLDAVMYISSIVMCVVLVFAIVTIIVFIFHILSGGVGA